ncbi:hypothetical protein BCR33DRAFT_80007 [Rhizoclosmatium globosum]|uniref:Uncharacterized protein n=1 Tax=Rhizoclosmatium globosum TaxID=329046 RepID=A0A1Y2CLS6_9FUNG|nr:hypothetical protein BCR33DRAFT_80007 [Rhizoclosmatium globosum]|eukprot:ORY47824.1 hypothetical protein BCR33DRAFT_80007 [Rhizoclosmatium globosum]
MPFSESKSPTNIGYACGHTDSSNAATCQTPLICATTPSRSSCQLAASNVGEPCGPLRRRRFYPPFCLDGLKCTNSVCRPVSGLQQTCGPYTNMPICDSGLECARTGTGVESPSFSCQEKASKKGESCGIGYHGRPVAPYCAMEFGCSNGTCVKHCKMKDACLFTRVICC